MYRSAGMGGVCFFVFFCLFVFYVLVLNERFVGVCFRNSTSTGKGSSASDRNKGDPVDGHGDRGFRFAREKRAKESGLAQSLPHLSTSFSKKRFAFFEKKVYSSNFDCN